MSILDFCRARGIIIDELPPVGIWRRFKTTDKPQHRNGAVKFMGDHGFCQNHATMTAVEAWHEAGANRAAQPIDQAKVDAQRARERAARIEAMRKARSFWESAKPHRRLHPYIERKGLLAQGCAGLRVHGDLLVIPVIHGQWVISVQTITPDGEKRFWPGAPVKAGAYVLDRERAAVTCLVEGLATGLAVYQAVRNAAVIVAFDAGNLLPVAQRLKPRGSVVVCGDNDHGTEARRGVNPGLEKARNVADWLGCGVAYPQGIEGTDWADAAKEFGERSAKRIEREILKEARYVAGPP